MSGTLAGFYLNPHRRQMDGSRYERENCTPTTGGNGANASTGGRINRTGGSIRALLGRTEETDPYTAGWSIPDLHKALSRIGVPFDNRTGDGWDGLTSALHAGQYVAVQGDSDQFPNGTCSGEFNGRHCIGAHPATRVVNFLRQHWIDDSVCDNGRWEYDYIIKRYAVKGVSGADGIRFGVFTHPVPRSVAPTGTKYRVAMIGGKAHPTPLRDGPSGPKVSSVSIATYICTRHKVDGQWWYQILPSAITRNRGLWISPTRYTKVTVA